MASLADELSAATSVEDKGYFQIEPNITEVKQDLENNRNIISSILLFYFRKYCLALCCFKQRRRPCEHLFLLDPKILQGKLHLLCYLRGKNPPDFPT